jgi:hypothetical protein
MKKQCENCSKEFEQKQDHQKFCSTSCRTENHYKRKFGLKEPFKAELNAYQTETITDDEKRLKTALNADKGIFDRLLDEREARMTDKIKLAQAEMRIQMLEKEVEDAKGFATIARELAPALAQLLTPINQPK